MAKTLEAKYPLPEWVHSLNTMKTNGAKAAFSLPQYTEEGSYSAFPFCEPFQVKTLTLKGRIEFKKDYKAVLYAASQTPGIASLKFDGFTIEVTWLSKGISNNGEKIDFIEDATRHIAMFVQQVKEAPDLPCFSELGLETHVFWQSLKPINEYDGERNGFWGHQY